MFKQSFFLDHLMQLSALSLGLSLSLSYAQPQSTITPNVSKTTFKSSDVGKVIYTFPPLERDGSNLVVRAEEATFINGIMAYAGLGSKGTWLWDLHTPSQPKLVKKMSRSFNIHTMPFMGDSFFPFGAVWDMSNPVNPKEIGNTSLACQWSYLSYPYMYFSYPYDQHELNIVDYTNVKTPALVKKIALRDQTGFEADIIIVCGNLLIAAGGQKGLSTFDLSDPINPKLLATVKDSPGSYFSFLYGNQILVANTDGKTAVYDITDPTDIKKQWEGRPEGMGDYGHFQNGFMYGAREGKWLKFNMKTFETVVKGTTTGTRYAVPLGNLVWIGVDTPNGGTPTLAVADTAPDNIGPSVNATWPKHAASRQNTKSRIGLSFDEQIDNRYLNDKTIIVKPIGGEPLAGWVSHTLGLVTFWPKQELQTNTTYEVSVAAGALMDWSGNMSPAPFSSRFSTGPSVDLNGYSAAIIPISKNAPKGFGQTQNRIILSPSASLTQHIMDRSAGALSAEANTILTPADLMGRKSVNAAAGARVWR